MLYNNLPSRWQRTLGSISGSSAKVWTCGKVTEERTAKKILKFITVGKISVEKQWIRWLDDVKNGLRTMDVMGWRKIARVVTNTIWPWRKSVYYLDRTACGAGRRRREEINVKWSCCSPFLLDSLEARRNMMQGTLSSEVRFSWDTQMLARGKITFWKWGLYTARTYAYVTLDPFFCFWRSAPRGPGPPHSWGF